MLIALLGKKIPLLIVYKYNGLYITDAASAPLTTIHYGDVGCRARRMKSMTSVLPKPGETKTTSEVTRRPQFLSNPTFYLTVRIHQSHQLHADYRAHHK